MFITYTHHPCLLLILITHIYYSYSYTLLMLVTHSHYSYLLLILVTHSHYSYSLLMHTLMISDFRLRQALPSHSITHLFQVKPSELSCGGAAPLLYRFSSFLDFNYHLILNIFISLLSQHPNPQTILAL